MATLTPVAEASGAVATAYAAATSGGDTIATGGANDVVLRVRNASAASVTVTMTGVRKCSQGQLHDATFTCAVGDTDCAVPAHCVDRATGDVAVTYSASASVTVVAVVA